MTKIEYEDRCFPRSYIPASLVDFSFVSNTLDLNPVCALEHIEVNV
jgi:hypothetical protein